ncbi:hypothetical protein Tco_1560980, partial [Tanacetum coccineum]
LRWSPVIPSLITTVIVPQFWAVSSKMTLSSALIATVALLIIVFVVAVVVVVVVVVVICRPASTVSSQMANPLAVIAPRHHIGALNYDSASQSLFFLDLPLAQYLSVIIFFSVGPWPGYGAARGSGLNWEFRTMPLQQQTPWSIKALKCAQ